MTRPLPSFVVIPGRPAALSQAEPGIQFSGQAVKSWIPDHHCVASGMTRSGGGRLLPLLMNGQVRVA